MLHRPPHEHQAHAVSMLCALHGLVAGLIVPMALLLVVMPTAVFLWLVKAPICFVTGLVRKIFVV
jgi:hypothetical protein